MLINGDLFCCVVLVGGFSYIAISMMAEYMCPVVHANHVITAYEEKKKNKKKMVRFADVLA